VKTERDLEKEPEAAAAVMKVLNELPEGSQARILLAVCGWCGFDGAVFALMRYATGEDRLPVAELPPDIPKPPPSNYS
jgi:hypothetical protein